MHFSLKQSKDSKNLCESCDYLSKTVFENGQSVLHCTYHTHRMRLDYRVLECTDYYDKGRQGINEMRRTAWLIEGEGRKMGFVAPGKITKERRKELLAGVAGYDDD